MTRISTENKTKTFNGEKYKLYTYYFAVKQIAQGEAIDLRRLGYKVRRTYGIPPGERKKYYMLWVRKK